MADQGRGVDGENDDFRDDLSIDLPAHIPLHDPVDEIHQEGQVVGNNADIAPEGQERPGGNTGVEQDSQC